MSINETFVRADPDTVFDVLADPAAYPKWVVGETKSRAWDPDWPEPGATLHHTQGIFGIGLADTTSVLASKRPRQLVLEVRARPVMVGQVELRLRRTPGGGTRVTMLEHPTGGLLKPFMNPLLDAAYHLRNMESLRRLRALAEERA